MSNQIIIVEGKSDTQKLKKIFGEQIQTLETQGLGINQTTINVIKKLSMHNQIIIFTDPDGPGKKIRELVVSQIETNIFNAFIDKSSFTKQHQKIGVAEASDIEIKNALNNLITFNSTKPFLSWHEYKNSNFYLKNNRKIVLNKLGINLELSSKSFFKWLNWMQLTKTDIEVLIKE